jgi:hypothetical protein
MVDLRKWIMRIVASPDGNDLDRAEPHIPMSTRFNRYCGVTMDHASFHSVITGAVARDIDAALAEKRSCKASHGLVDVIAEPAGTVVMSRGGGCIRLTPAQWTAVKTHGVAL